MSAAVSPASPTVRPGDTLRLSAVFGTCSGVKPVTWSIDSPAVAEIVAADSRTVLLRGLVYGNAVVSAHIAGDTTTTAASLLRVFFRASPTAYVTVRPASTHVVRTRGQLSVEVTTTVVNPSRVNLRVGAGPLCPDLSFFPDPTGEFTLPGGFASCPMDPSVVLAPGDSIVLHRAASADWFNALAPGTYGVQATVTSDDVIVAVWGGTIQVPLSPTP